MPSLTELVFALGLGSHLVARTGFCLHPRAALARVPKIGGTKDVNLAKLERLRPTHVLVNVDENRRETVAAMRGWGAHAPEIVVTHPCGPQDNIALVAQLAACFGQVAGVAERAAALAAALQRELDATQPAGRPPQQVLYLIWHGPWMTVARDTYLSRMLGRVHWQTLPDVRGGPSGAARYPVVQGSEPWLRDVQRVLLSSEPCTFTPAHEAEARAMCPQATVQRVDGELLSWYGPRAVDGLRYLRALAAPGAASTIPGWTSTSR